MKKKLHSVKELAEYILNLRDDETLDGFDFIDKVCEICESCL